MSDTDVSATPPLWGFWPSLLLGIGLWLVYSANLATHPVSDTEAATLLPVAVIRGDGVFLDRFEKIVEGASSKMAAFSTRSRGHLVSMYPVGPGLIAVPLTAPQVWLLDLLKPRWESDAKARSYLQLIAKNSSAAIAAIAGVLLLHGLRLLGLSRVALIAVLATALGTDLWVVASQAPWQHGPAVLALCLAMLCLGSGENSPTRIRMVVAGLAAGALVAFRSIDLVFAATIALWVVWRFPRELGWFLPGPVLIGASLLGFNLWCFGTIEGGQKLIEGGRSFADYWTTPLAAGLTGTLFSPNRGLFVFCPWVLVSILVLPWSWKRLPRRSVHLWLIVALVPYLVVLSLWRMWWGGHSFGPRFWTDACPIFGVILAAGLAEVKSWRAKWPSIFLGVTICVAVVFQAIGAACYPSSWNYLPSDVDNNPGRLWDWRDTELRRCLTDGLNPRLNGGVKAVARRVGFGGSGR